MGIFLERSVTTLLFLLFYVLVSVGYANVDIDSLRKVNADLSDQAFINLLISEGNKVFTSTPEKTLELGQVALDLSNNIEYREGQANSLRVIGLGYHFKGRYPLALQYYFQSLQVAEEDTLYTPTIKALNNIGVVYLDTDRYGEALKIFNDLLNTVKSDDRRQWQKTYNNLGIIYKNREDYDSALLYYEKAKTIAVELDDHSQLAIYTYNIGNLYVKKNDWNVAVPYLKKSLALANEVGNSYLIISNKNRLGEFYVLQNSLVRAQTVLEEARELAKKEDLRKLLADNYNMLSYLYQGKGETAKALEYSKKYVQLKELLIQDESARLIASMEEEYQRERKIRENEVLRKDNEIKDKEIKSRNILILGIISSIFLLIVALSFMTKHSKLKSDANRELTALNEEIMSQHDQIEAQAEALSEMMGEMKELNNTLEQKVEERTQRIKEQGNKILEYTIFNAHNLRGPLARILGLCSLMESEQIPEEVKRLSDKINDEVKSLDDNLKRINALLENEEELELIGDIQSILRKFDAVK